MVCSTEISIKEEKSNITIHGVSRNSVVFFVYSSSYYGRHSFSRSDFRVVLS